MNPHRAAEIWQYVYVINTAAANYVWENVSFYDYTFRQMMSVNPQRSWSKIFNQMWNLVMHEPIMRNQNGSQRSNYQSGNNFNGNGSAGRDLSNFRKRWKSDVCWRFNRNKTCKPGCNFEHKCSYCGQHGHSVIDCPKLKNKGGNFRSGNHNNAIPGNSNNNNNKSEKHNSRKED